jgi:hypothetical protein
MSDYGMPPDPSAVGLGDTDARARLKNEAWSRFEMTPEKFEMGDGKLFWSDEQRLRMLGLLLENCGAEAAVRMGDPAIWRDAVARLADEDATLEYAVDAACRWRGSFDARYDLGGILSFYDRVTTPDYEERTESGAANRDTLTEQARQRNARKETRSGDYSVCTVYRETVRRDGETAVAVVRQETKHRRYAPTPEDPKVSRALPDVLEIERWRETWVKNRRGVAFATSGACRGTVRLVGVMGQERQNR